MADVRPNVLVLKTMLKSIFEMRGVEFADWEKDWGEIDSFFCRTSSACDNCLTCQLECQNYDSNLNIVSSSWSDCEYPYGFSIDNGLSGEQQAIIAVTVVLAIVFVMCCYYLLNGIFIYYSENG